MSDILSTYIFIELQKINPNPFFAPQQKQLADAIAKAVQKYINERVIIINAVPASPVIPVKPLAP